MCTHVSRPHVTHMGVTCHTHTSHTHMPHSPTFPYATLAHRFNRCHTRWRFQEAKSHTLLFGPSSLTHTSILAIHHRICNSVPPGVYHRVYTGGYIPPRMYTAGYITPGVYHRMYTSGYIPPDTSQRIFPLQFATQGSDETARREWQWSLKKAKLRQLQAGVDAMSAADGGEEAAASAETHLSLVAKIINNLQAKKKKKTHTHTKGGNARSKKRSHRQAV